MNNIVSFSGGRTSAYLVWLTLQMDKDFTYIFMDTGAEHQRTYEFVREVVKRFNIKLICLKVKINKVLGEGNSYTEISLADIGKDLQPWVDMMSKYSSPYMPSGAFCTNMMKLNPYTKYCVDKFGKKNFITWLGMREDEPRRLVDRENYKYLADISSFDKADVIEWWDRQDFNLDLIEPLGNCVFCIKKGVNKIALAAKDEPIMAEKFASIIESSTVRVIEKRKCAPTHIFRGQMSLRQIITAYDHMDRDELFDSLRSSKALGCGGESCEIFNGQMDFFNE